MKRTKRTLRKFPDTQNTLKIPDTSNTLTKVKHVNFCLTPWKQGETNCWWKSTNLNCQKKKKWENWDRVYSFFLLQTLALPMCDMFHVLLAFQISCQNICSLHTLQHVFCSEWQVKKPALKNGNFIFIHDWADLGFSEVLKSKH